MAQFSLKEYIKSNSEPIPLNEALLIITSLFLNLLNLHATCNAHRDIKPDNVLYFFKKGNPWKFCDYGVSKKYAFVKEDCEIAGTPKYLPKYIKQYLEQYNSGDENSSWL